MSRELLLGLAVKRGRHDDDGRLAVLCAEAVTELVDLGGILLATVDHDAIRPGIPEREGTGERIFHATLKNQAFDTRDDHEVIGELDLLASCDFGTEFVDGSLGLLDLGAEEGVLLQTRLVLDDDGGDAHTLKGADVVHEVLGQPTRVTIEDDWLGGDLHDVVYRA